MSRRTYTPDEKAKALELYRNLGPAEAERQTSIPKKTIASWAARSGVQTSALANTKAATEQLSADLAVMRAALRRRLVETAADLIERMHQPHVEHKVVGQKLEVVEHAKPTAPDARNYAIAAAILIDKDMKLEEADAPAPAALPGGVGVMVERLRVVLADPVKARELDAAASGWERILFGEGDVVEGETVEEGEN